MARSSGRRDDRTVRARAGRSRSRGARWRRAWCPTCARSVHRRAGRPDPDRRRPRRGRSPLGRVSRRRRGVRRECHPTMAHRSRSRCRRASRTRRTARCRRGRGYAAHGSFARASIAGRRCGAMERDLPLRGLRVVDSTDATSWSASRHLADLGADVIRVDVTGQDVDALYATRNVNKRSVVLDGDGLRALLPHADVWFETGGTALDVRAVRRELPRLVIVSISPFGSTGPYAEYAATHPVVYALCGQLASCRLAGRPPLLPPARLAFEVAAAMAAYSALVAVWNRAINGAGDRLDLSIHEAMIQTIDTQVAGASVRRSGPPTTTMTTGGFGHPAFPTADGMVRPLVVSARQWQALREWVGDPVELRGDELATYGGRGAHPEVMAAVYRRLFAGTSTEAICEEAQKRNVPATPVMSPGQLLASEPMRTRGTFATTVVDGREAVLPAGY